MTTLEIRRPETTWMLTGVLVTLCLHGLLWWVFSGIVSLNEPVRQSRQVMISALFWMIGALAWWKYRLPQSRLHAVMSVLGCVLLVAIVGTVFAFLALVFRGVVFDHQVTTTFSLLGGVLLIAQLILALPSSLVLQGLVLRRRAPEAPQLPG